MEFIAFLKDILRILAVTALPVFVYLWWDNSTPRQRDTYTAYFWMFILAVGAFGILYSLFTTGSIGIPTGYDPGN